jgi:hypothetical protein
MRLFRSLFNGIGSGAGVAWPLFGVVFTLLGGSIGGLLSLTLGITSIFIFFTISIPIFYFSYQEMKNKEYQFQEQLEKNKQKLLADINNYVHSIYKHYLNQTMTQDFISYFKEIIYKDLEEIAKKDINSPLYQILQVLGRHNNVLTINEIILEHITRDLSQKPTPLYKLLVPSFLAFVGTFGSIAGCSAGVSGLLTGMGIFTSFVAFPLLGWSIIGVAVIFGVITAVAASQDAQEEFKNNEINQLIKKIHRQFDKANFERDLDTALHETTSSVATTQEAKRDLFTKINKPIISILHTKHLSHDKPDLNFVSFFRSDQINASEPEIENTETLIHSI